VTRSRSKVPTVKSLLAEAVQRSRFAEQQFAELRRELKVLGTQFTGAYGASLAALSGLATEQATQRRMLGKLLLALARLYPSSNGEIAALTRVDKPTYVIPNPRLFTDDELKTIESLVNGPEAPLLRPQA